MAASFDVLLPAGYLTLTALVCGLLVWGEAATRWSELKVPPRPHDPARYFDRRLDSWRRGPEPLRDRLGDGPTPDGRARGVVRVAEVVAVLDGTSSDDEGTVLARLRLRLADGGSTVLEADVADVLDVGAGTFLPVRRLPESRASGGGDSWETAWELTGPQIGRVLLDHRAGLGLVDEDGHRELCQRLGDAPESATVATIRPTGAVRAGQVEVELAVDVDGRPSLVRGFLRPDEIATARHTGRVPVTRSTRGGWLLWPTWY
ncbi:hypothetical protein [Streptomyces sp. NBRC 109706]|uniref:hypothetical protein n=1 Tax=Streptomyces sp. NBRC 109706 TaxID=1550035 RepID=UPI0007830FA0|nr:hypothetical protein [Streptomyces sp. NBRC 109706]